MMVQLHEALRRSAVLENVEPLGVFSRRVLSGLTLKEAQAAYAQALPLVIQPVISGEEQIFEKIRKYQMSIRKMKKRRRSKRNGRAQQAADDDEIEREREEMAEDADLHKLRQFGDRALLIGIDICAEGGGVLQFTFQYPIEGPVEMYTNARDTLASMIPGGFMMGVDPWKVLHVVAMAPQRFGGSCIELDQPVPLCDVFPDAVKSAEKFNAGLVACAASYLPEHILRDSKELTPRLVAMAYNSGLSLTACSKHVCDFIVACPQVTRDLRAHTDAKNRSRRAAAATGAAAAGEEVGAEEDEDDNNDAERKEEVTHPDDDKDEDATVVDHEFVTVCIPKSMIGPRPMWASRKKTRG